MSLVHSVVDEEAPEVLPEEITSEQWDRILAGGRKVRWLVKPEQVAWAGKRIVSCGSCVHTEMHSDPRRGWCTEHRFMVSMAFPLLCREHVDSNAPQVELEPEPA